MERQDREVTSFQKGRRGGEGIEAADSREEAGFSTRQSFAKMHRIECKKQQPFRERECVV